MTDTKLKHPPIYCCKRLRMHSWLSRKGWIPFQIIDEKDEEGNLTGFQNWLYANEPNFERDVEEYLSQFKK